MKRLAFALVAILILAITIAVSLVPVFVESPWVQAWLGPVWRRWRQ